MSFELSSDYRQWLQQLKSQFQHTQQNAVRAVNTEMLKFYPLERKTSGFSLRI
ncbi:hypothetical protein F967_00714 [Acinetobacter sp. CIP 102637]|uniref:hypothetical protein n=1 Tax=unclassified Acinetobacter TaxID=196816 RepID=UPI0002CEC069|nr:MULTISPECIES: hypothetical protein [unclassified Acinetobacter]ENU86557.1 hypothetical protein F973_01212 [Acinetobacter sp. CIP 102129]ENV06801.1 hypothetical protein F967_00714 [Acinetobacter sp. CIP 102637]